MTDKDIVKIKVSLQDMPHKVERTVLVPANSNMRQMHFIIQESMGWFNAHLFQFNDNKSQANIKISAPDDFDIEFSENQDKLIAHEASLKSIFIEKNESKPFWYWYDFGDDWWHKISFLKVTNKDIATYKGFPICIKAEGKCPPEDIGGPWGYANFLDVIKNKKHPEHKELVEWLGIDTKNEYDETQVDLEEINDILFSFYEDEWDTEEYFYF